MSAPQIARYMETIDRLTRGHCYMKQWKKSVNPFDGLTLTERDYPIPERWQAVYHRDCPSNTDFFEALYSVPGDD